MSRAAESELTKHRHSLMALTGIRFLAAVYVVLFHSTLGERLVQSGHRLAGHFFENGFLAVSLFFLLSGFILSYTYQGQVNTWAQRRRFWEARVARIWPVYVVSLIVTAAVLLVVPKLSYSIASTLMLQAWNPFDHAMWGAGNYVCWTISVEAFFYLVFPAFQLWMQRVSAREQLVSLGGALLLCVYLNSGAYTLGYPAHGLIYWVPLPLVRLPEFFAGVCLGNLFLRFKANLAEGNSFTPSRVPGVLTYSSAFLALASLCLATGRWCSLVLIPFALLLWGLATERTVVSYLLSTRTFVFGGGISYSIYLLQTAAKDAVTTIADRFGIASSAFRMGVMALLLIVASCLTFKLVEEPARRLLRGAFARQEARRQRRLLPGVSLSSLPDAGS